MVEISLGTHVATCIDSSGMIWAWGQNSYGELGVGDYNEKAKPYPVMALKAKKVSKVSCGGCFYIALGKPVELKKPLGISNTKSKRILN